MTKTEIEEKINALHGQRDNITQEWLGIQTRLSEIKSCINGQRLPNREYASYMAERTDLNRALRDLSEQKNAVSAQIRELTSLKLSLPKEGEDGKKTMRMALIELRNEYQERLRARESNIGPLSAPVTTLEVITGLNNIIDNY